MEQQEADSSSTISRKRTRRTTSDVWQFYEHLSIGDDGIKKVKCLKCAKIYVVEARSGTSNFIRHANKCFPCDNDSEINQLRRLPLNHEVFRDKVAISIIKHNYPFKYVEHEGTRDVHFFLNSEVKFITRNTAKADVLKIYEKEKVKIKSELENLKSRVCLTTDLWKTIVTDGYMSLTAHYIDDNWKLQTRVLNFHHVSPPHSGPILGEEVVGYFQQWGIEKKIFTITLDNAKYNDSLMGHLKDYLSLKNALICGGEFLHVRCGAHILNLIVQAGLKVIDESVYKIRESVKYVKGSELRKAKFADHISNLGLKCGNKVRQDMPIRWNSTYLMLESALKYRQAFDQLSKVDLSFKTCPLPDEWKKVERITRFLQPFFDITTLFSGTSYPTANLYFQSVWKIQLLIEEEMNSTDEYMKVMATEMMEKFEKYWECYSVVLSFASILDPRYKLKMIEFVFSKIYPATYRDRVLRIRGKLYDLFEEYKNVVPCTSSSQSSIGSMSKSPIIRNEMSEFDSFESQHHGTDRFKSQLDLYLEEPLLNWKENLDLDILTFWKGNEGRYPELCLMVRDVLSIPITSVASESSFSIGGRVLGKYRTSLLPSNLEILLCTQNWLNGVGKGESDDEEEEGLAEDFENLIISGD